MIGHVHVSPDEDAVVRGIALARRDAGTRFKGAAGPAANSTDGTEAEVALDTATTPKDAPALLFANTRRHAAWT